MPDHNKFNGLSREQKIGFVLLLCFAFLAVGLGVLQIRNTLYKSFALNNSIPPNVAETINSVDALHYRDTDGDGLSDFDELYVYGTSPYLADTDSDGIPDGQEIKNGTNPLCAEGKQCTGLAINPAAVPVTSASTSIPGNPGPAPDYSALVNTLKDPAKLRPLLVQSGADPEMLKQISDDDLVKMVEESLNSTSTRNNIQAMVQKAVTTTSP